MSFRKKNSSIHQPKLKIYKHSDEPRFEYCRFCFYFGNFQVLVTSFVDFTVVRLGSDNPRFYGCDDYQGLKIRSVRSARKVAERYFVEWSSKYEALKV